MLHGISYISKCINLQLMHSIVVTSRKKMFQVQPKSLYRSRAVSYFYETEFEIWICFEPAIFIKIETDN